MDPADPTQLTTNQTQESAPPNNTVLKKNNWKRIVTISAVAIIVILLGVVIYRRYYIGSRPESNSVLNDLSNKFKTDNKVKLVESPLSGEKVSAQDSARHPLGVIIENTPDARPQSGLEKASIIYEAETEGGITRFL